MGSVLALQIRSGAQFVKEIQKEGHSKQDQEIRNVLKYGMAKGKTEGGLVCKLRCDREYIVIRSIFG